MLFVEYDGEGCVNCCGAWCVGEGDGLERCGVENVDGWLVLYDGCFVDGKCFLFVKAGGGDADFFLSREVVAICCLAYRLDEDWAVFVGDDVAGANGGDLDEDGEALEVFAALAVVAPKVS